MPSFGKDSLKQLASCCSELQMIADTVIQFFDFSVLEGHRSKEKQNQAYLAGKSKVKWPNGKHNRFPSDAFDVAPFPIDWSDDEDATRRFVYLAGHIKAVAEMKGIKIRWGGDWDRDNDIRNEKGKLRDWGHFEIVRD